MDIKNKLWMNGQLEWFCYIGDEEFFLGKREVPYPLDEGDQWVNQFGDAYKVENGEIIFLGKQEPPERTW